MGPRLTTTSSRPSPHIFSSQHQRRQALEPCECLCEEELCKCEARLREKQGCVCVCGRGLGPGEAVSRETGICLKMTQCASRVCSANHRSVPDLRASTCVRSRLATLSPLPCNICWREPGGVLAVFRTSPPSPPPSHRPLTPSQAIAKHIAGGSGGGVRLRFSIFSPKKLAQLDSWNENKQPLR